MGRKGQLRKKRSNALFLFETDRRPRSSSDERGRDNVIVILCTFRFRSFPCRGRSRRQRPAQVTTTGCFGHLAIVPLQWNDTSTWTYIPCSKLVTIGKDALLLPKAARAPAPQAERTVHPSISYAPKQYISLFPGRTLNIRCNYGWKQSLIKACEAYVLCKLVWAYSRLHRRQIKRERRLMFRILRDDL